MKTAAVIIDAWKQDIFTRRLQRAGYGFEKVPGISPHLLTLKVPYAGDDELPALAKVVKAAQLECVERARP